MITENNVDIYKQTLDRWKMTSLENVGTLVKAEAKINLEMPTEHRGGGMYPTHDTGNLGNSIEYLVDYVNKNSVVIGTPLEYAIYIEKGARAHYMPVAELTAWVKRKFKGDIKLLRSKAKRGKKQSTEDNAIKTLVFLINRSMSKNPMPPMPFLEPAVLNNLDRIKAELLNFNWSITASKEGK